MSSTPDPAESAPAVDERTKAEEWLGTKPQKPGLLHRIAAVWKDEYDTATRLDDSSLMVTTTYLRRLGGVGDHSRERVAGTNGVA